MTDIEQRIYDAAVAEFTQKGYYGARMQRIADAADANKSLLHYYFRNKQQLYERTVGQFESDFQAGFSILLDANRTLVQKLEDFVLHYHTLLRKAPQLTAFFAKQFDAERLPPKLVAPDSPLLSDLRDGIQLGLLRKQAEDIGLIHILSAVFYPILTFGQPANAGQHHDWHDQLDTYYTDLPKRLLDALRQ